MGKVPVELQVDNSTAATHRISTGVERSFNQDFVFICEHYGLKPRTIGIECPNENGDVESSNGHLKRRLCQHLLLRGSRDFASEADYGQFLGPYPSWSVEALRRILLARTIEFAHVGGPCSLIVSPTTRC